MFDVPLVKDNKCSEDITLSDEGSSRGTIALECDRFGDIPALEKDSYSKIYRCHINPKCKMLFNSFEDTYRCVSIDEKQKSNNNEYHPVKTVNVDNVEENHTPIIEHFTN